MSCTKNWYLTIIITFITKHGIFWWMSKSFFKLHGEAMFNLSHIFIAQALAVGVFKINTIKHVKHKSITKKYTALKQKTLRPKYIISFDRSYFHTSSPVNSIQFSPLVFRTSIIYGYHWLIKMKKYRRSHCIWRAPKHIGAIQRARDHWRKRLKPLH